MPILEVASTAQVEPLIVPWSAAPLRGACQVTLGASARAANGRPAERASETAALRRRTLLGNFRLGFIGAPSLFSFENAMRRASTHDACQGKDCKEISRLAFPRRTDCYGYVVRRRLCVVRFAASACLAAARFVADAQLSLVGRQRTLRVLAG